MSWLAEKYYDSVHDSWKTMLIVVFVEYLCENEKVIIHSGRTLNVEWAT